MSLKLPLLQDREQLARLVADTFRNLLAVYLILLVINYLYPVVVEFYFNLDYLLYILIGLGSALLIFYAEKLEISDTARLDELKTHISYVFLGLLLIVTVQSLFPNVLEWGRSSLMVAAVAIGAVTFYLNRDNLGDFEEEARQEEMEEKRREMEFANKYPQINRVWGLRHIVRWIYREGWWYSTGLVVIFSIFFITRLYENDFINGSDNYNVLGIKNMYENGFSFYKYSPITDYFMLQIVKMFGFNLLTIKVPFIFYSFITLIFIYLIGRLLSKNLALLSSFLYVISPWAIIQSRITRDYSFDLMVGSIVLYLCLIVYKRLRDVTNTKDYAKILFLFSLIPITIILLYEYNRQQTLTVGIYVLLVSVFIIEHIFTIITNNNKLFNSVYWVTTSSILLLVLYFIDRFPFKYGFNNQNSIFFQIFFDPLLNSPWQWFHEINIDPLFLFALFFLGIFSFGSNTINKKCILILFSAFIFTLLLYTLKYESHVNYIPVRYIYFLFVPYVIILTNAILNIFKLFKTKFEKITIIILLIAIINPTALIYSINPPLAYDEEGISNVQIDNIGIGRFEMLKVVSYLENELNVNDDTIVIFDGRYGEFILYLNRSMDMEKDLIRRAGHHYDVSKNTYVQSNYFGYYELKEAVADNPQGIYISTEKVVINENEEVEIKLSNDDFYLYDTLFKFNKYINGAIG